MWYFPENLFKKNNTCMNEYCSKECMQIKMAMSSLSGSTVRKNLFYDFSNIEYYLNRTFHLLTNEINNS